MKTILLHISFICFVQATIQQNDHISDQAELHGWDTKQLQSVISTLSKFGSHAFILESNGQRIVEFGNIKKPYWIRSIRKSLLSALIGIAIDSAKINLNTRLVDLDIDDVGGLSDQEKQASLLDLIKSRSGVYHDAASMTAEDKKKRPKRYSYKAGEQWYYNNWDFNALGKIYQNLTRKSVFEAFKQEIAEPLEMQDFSLQNTRYKFEKVSLYPAYHFELSARDLLKFGSLYLNGGNYNGQQIISESYITASTQSYSVTGRTGTRSGYGYMWWVITDKTEAILQDSFLASGSKGQKLIIIPKINTVIVHLIDKRSGEKGIGTSQFERLLKQIIAAKRTL